MASLTPPATATPAPRSKLAILAVGALGVVFGDIGTSPLYAFRQCFLGDNAPAPTPDHILGILSLIFWTLVSVVCIKYTIFVLQANHDGEGGTLALLGLLYPTESTRAYLQGALPPIAAIILFGTAALYGDGVITPAISVLSAVEGLNVWTAAAQSFTVPITVAILLGLFAFQSRGTGKIGAMFGPVMVLWFLTIGTLGAVALARHPAALAALDPLRALSFVAHGGMTTVVVLGATVLAVSGVEALYADLGHFGIGPIRLAWYAVAFPALALNYFGQGALALGDPSVLQDSSFYALVPSWGLVPMVILATAATIIASQALISGAFSLTQQAVQLGYVPRVNVMHTSDEQEGQIYIPFVNAMLAILCILLVIGFKKSERLADAYGLAVTITMLTTTFAYAALTRVKWNRPWWQTAAVTAFFLLFDGSFLIGNIPKIPTGGWIPLVIALVVFTFFVTWYAGRRRHGAVLAKMSIPVDEFLRDIDARPPVPLVGTAIFLTAHPSGIPYALSHQWLRSHVTFEVVVLLTIVYEASPYVHNRRRITLEELRENTFYRVTASYGFMEMPDTHEILQGCRQADPDYDFKKTVFYLAESEIVAAKGPGAMAGWQRTLYAWMVTNSRPLSTVLKLPISQIVKVGVEIPV